MDARSLAWRHGHALVTPLHVARAILSSSSMPAAGGLLRLSGRPLRREDMKISLDEALSRLPVAFPVGSEQLTLSNALVALLRRAHMIQRQRSVGGLVVGGRRRCQVATVKTELKHLVASILDDPSVHRAMRKAGCRVAEPSNQPSSVGTVCQVLDRPVATNLTCHSCW
jgi:hypothetical protein